MNKKGLLFFLLLALTILILFLFNLFLSYTPYRACYSLSDPVHNTIEAIDFSKFILPLTYLPVIVYIVVMRNMHDLNRLLMAFALTQLVRMVCIYVVPLCEPMGAIRLEDGLLNTIFYPNGYCAYDLFYSGHTATLFLITLYSSAKWRWFFLTLTLAVASMLVLQKVHYTIDVVMAFPVTWIVSRLATQVYFFLAKETKMGK